MDQNLYEKYVILIQVHYWEEVKIYFQDLGKDSFS